ncbi:hypothetical protein [Variovorax sp. EL159]|uniref:hypothetical protein n=1 Tax=Variovorax sp. EL159 TaxID=1566270 RepID=UPI0008878963|nr:hypothetical protein [Variovorax sp. EL159]SCX53323.1 hypothetical protein SAMN03159363_1313 [Variovorax sp. EL159]SCX53346.1 hypothetical protein SAMN03159363_1316 [Variovorax sp. EL159]
MIDIVAIGTLLYTLGKDYKERGQWKDEKKLVDYNWPDQSGFKEKAAEQGYEVRWVRPDKVAARELEGYDVMLERDAEAKVSRTLVLWDGNVLMGRKVQS